jgi:tetratricopeptide (TPR) repeat protein
MRFVLAVVAPVVFIAALEVALRLLQVGCPSGLTLGLHGEGGARVRVMNPAFTVPFFGREQHRRLKPVALREKESADEWRVVVLGGSAAQGDPLPDFGFPRVMEVLLQDAFPNRRIRVINAAMTAVNSHVVRVAAAGLKPLEPDVVIVYMGNNEVVGPFGPGTVFGPFNDSLNRIRASIAIRRSRLGQALLRIMGGRKGTGSEWQGMAVFAGARIAQDDTRLERVYDHFAANLQAIVKSVEEAGAQCVLSTVAVNLADWPPFASGRDGEAAALYTEGRDLLAEGAVGRARVLLFRARDADALRFRADTELNARIRSVAEDSEHCMMVDAERLIDEACSEGIANSEVFVDHVHFNFHGNYVLGRAFAEAVTGVLSGPSAKRLDLDEMECGRALGYGPHIALETADQMQERLILPPFNRQRGQRERLMTWREEEREQRSTIQETGWGHISAVLRAARSRRPADPALARWQGYVYLAHGKPDDALKEFEQAAALAPYDDMARVDLAMGWAVLGQLEHALAALDKEPFDCALTRADLLVRTAQELNKRGARELVASLLDAALVEHPDHPVAHAEYGQYLLAARRAQAAVTHFKLALEADAAMHRARLGLAVALTEEGALDEAVPLFDKVVEATSQPEAFYSRGVARLKQGNPDGARADFQQALSSNPSDVDAMVQLADLAIEAGRWTAAAARLREAVRWKPGFLPAWRKLGRSLYEGGLPHEAIKAYDRVLALSRDDLEALASSAWMLATWPKEEVRDGARAVRLAHRACRVTHFARPDLLEVLAAAYAEYGAFEDAAQTQARAIETASVAPEEGKEMYARLAGYREGMPLRTRELWH